MPDGFVDLILTHIHRYPLLEAMDVYRLLHQAVFGPSGSVANRKAAREWLDHEVQLAIPDANRLLVESVHPTNEIVRVYMSPYQALGGSIPALLDAFIRSVHAAPSDLIAQGARLAEAWRAFTGMVAPGSVLAGRFEARTLSLIGRVRAAESWSAAPHSPIYLHHYQPYYRVLLRPQADQLMRQQSIPFQPI